MKIALGPILYCWPRERVIDFYDAAAATPVDIVYLGEVVCSRRPEMRYRDWIDVARRLARAGKEVVLSTQALLESEADLRRLRRVAGNAEFPIEANDMGAVHLIAGKQPFIAGLHLNIYNPQTLALIAGLGARRWLLPVELSRDALRTLQLRRPAGMETEVFAFGRMPLAFSARCFTARHHDLSKDSCGFRCIDDPDGMPMLTRDGRPFLALNGIQTQSAQSFNLIRELEEMNRLGVDVVRISPQSVGTFEVVDCYRQAIDQNLAPAVAAGRVEYLMPTGPCNGYWYGKPGIEQFTAA